MARHPSMAAYLMAVAACGLAACGASDDKGPPASPTAGKAAPIAVETPKPAASPVAPTPPETDDETAKVLATLATKRVRGLQFEEYDLDKVATYLKTVTGLTFFLTPKLRATKFDEVKVTLGPLDDVSVRHVLDLATLPYDLRWRVRGGIVNIGTKDEFGDGLRLYYYDIRDLVEAKGIDMDGLLAEVTRLAGADSSADLKNTILIVRATPPGLEAVRRLLDDRRSKAGLPAPDVPPARPPPPPPVIKLPPRR